MSIQNKTLKTAGIIIGSIIFFGIIIYALSGWVLEPYIKDKIRNNVQTFGKVKYTINFQDMDLQFLTGNIYFDRLEIIPEKDPLNITRDNYKLVIDKLSLLGFDFWSLIDGDSYEVDKIKIDGGAITVYKFVNVQPDVSDSTDVEPMQIGAITIGSIDINQGHFIIYNVGEGVHNPLFNGNIDLSVENIYYKYGPKWAEDLEYDHLISSFTEVSVKTPDSLRSFMVSAIRINGDNQLHHAEADSLKIRTRPDKYELAEILGHQGDWIHLDIPKIELQKWEIKPMLLNLAFKSSVLNVQNPDLDVFSDRRYPPDTSKTYELPYDFMEDLKTSFSIDTLSISNGSIHYQEHVKSMNEAGNITFSKFNAAIHNFTNDSATLEKNGRKAFLYANTALMNEAPLELKMTFNLEHNANNAVNGTVGKMDLTALNPIISHVGYVKIESGVCHSIDFNFTFDDKSAQGEVIFKYENLKIETISRNDGDDDSMGQNIKTFLADFAVDDENLDDDLRIGQVSYSRNINKSTINYWWKSLLTGLKSSVGISGEIKN